LNLALRRDIVLYAKLGVFAAIPFGVIVGPWAAWMELGKYADPVVSVILGVPVGILTYAIIGALLGAGFGIVQSRIPTHSTLLKALIYSLAVWLLFQVLEKATLLARLIDLAFYLSSMFFFAYVNKNGLRWVRRFDRFWAWLEP
jgi:hypothetical protein